MRGYSYTSMMLKALAHPVRLAILQVLRQDGESCVCHLEHALGQRQAYVSQQLASLRESGLVVDRRDGLNVYYTLSDDDLQSLLEVLIGVALSRAEREGIRLVFQMLDPDRAVSCPCPKCPGQVESTAAQNLEGER